MFVLRPRLLRLDEPSLGLAPIVVGAIFDNLVCINEIGQNVLRSTAALRPRLRPRERRYMASGARDALLADEGVKRAYLGR